MTSTYKRLRAWSMAAFVIAGGANPAAAAAVLMISVDGLKPEYVVDADRHGLKARGGTALICGRQVRSEAVFG